MKNSHEKLVPYGDCDPDDYEPSKSWLWSQLNLRSEDEEDWAAWNGDRDRVWEFLEFYRSHPEMSGWRRWLCADLIADSAIDLIEPEPVDELTPASEDESARLVRALLSDPHTRHYLLSSVREDMRASGFYKRIAALVDRILPEIDGPVAG